jgi:hypothetical protein
MITTINEFKIINEVRLPHGFFKVTNTFDLPDGEWDILFNKDNIIEIDTDEKYIKRWTTIYNNATGGSTNEWTETTFPYLDLMKPEKYTEFKNNTVKLSAEQTPKDLLKKGTVVNTKQFNTTVKGFNNKIAALQLDPKTKIKVIIL